MSNFLAALQAKSAKLSASMGNSAHAPAVAPAPIVTPTLAPAPIQNYSAGPLEVTVELPFGSNRIDVFFSRKPDADIIQRLKDAGFWYRPSDKAWFHKDCEKNRQTVRMLFGAEIEPYESQEAAEAEAEVEAECPIPAAPIVDESSEAPFNVYKRQCAELMGALECDFPDLALKAIDCLHRITFKRN